MQSALVSASAQANADRTTLPSSLSSFRADVTTFSHGGDTFSVVANGPQGSRLGVAVIVPGSGDLDEDGNDRLLMRTFAYRDLAQSLALEGLSTVRYRKRRMDSFDFSARPPGGGGYFAQLTADAKAVARETRVRLKVDCVWLIGHSEGGLISMIVSISNSDVCGVILLGSPGRTLGDILRWRFRNEPTLRRHYAEASSVISSLEIGEVVDYGSLGFLVSTIFNKNTDKYYREVIGIDPVVFANKCDKPFLVTQGGRDIQVSAIDAIRLNSACSSARLEIFPRMNHFMKNTDFVASHEIAREYRGEPKPITEGLPQCISSFILSAPLRPAEPEDRDENVGC
jgi:uncharacterized protein